MATILEKLPGIRIGRLDVTSVVKSTMREVADDDVSGLAAEMAYHSILALFPFLIFLAGVTSIIQPVFGVDLTDRIVEKASHVMPDDATSLVRSFTSEVVRSKSWSAIVAGLAGSLWASSAAVGVAMKALNRAYDVTEDRGFYCGGGVHAAMDLSLYLVEKFCGHDVAMQTAKAFLIETPRAWQAGFAVVPLKTEHDDEAIGSAQEWMHKHFRENFPLEAPADHAGMSMRNFVRRFKSATGDSPLIYLQKLRVAAAKRLLENDHRTMQEISDAVGYQDVAFFRQLFERHTGVSPSSYRERFGA